jgi:REP element-mobilizing transposase RayT
MPRPHRLHVPGGVYHVILRGNHRQPIFHQPSDRAMLDGLVADSLARFGARAHAYCWMTNHVHLAVQVADAPLGRIMQRIASQYARRVQWRLPTTGHLFERRYHAILVDADAYLLQLTRYIHLNPVRAGLAADPADYPWSSHRAYLGLASVPWLSTEFALRMLGADVDAARTAYLKLIGLGGDPSDSKQFCRGDSGDCRLLGPDDFKVAATGAAIKPQLRDSRTLEQLMRDVTADLGVSAAELASDTRSPRLTEARCVLTERALHGGVATITAVARRLNRSHSSLCETFERYLRRKRKV